ncbi:MULTISPECIES: hypothetical protein [unclassified Bradyrhizobium]|uniref:hypothetical protein n=1 Tax=unclassified Bradyrhizobium TaxID=2631580 RepID=UPI0024787E06|nr:MULTISPECIES: hypothetical protein [unclassified Bradyrhizobium]WGS18933.1 hypothetical protein MTX22_31140 [Bradyrhizobium sp. ISRA463]WGS25766.1 hypothetical protein MTX19_28710 [Bradyrhizobium sp. ISRA464]
MPKRTKATIKDTRAPFAIFLDQQSIDENLPCAIRETKIIADYRKDGDEASLWTALTELQWDYASIEAVIANRSYQPRTIYGLASSF